MPRLNSLRLILLHYGFSVAGTLITCLVGCTPRSAALVDRILIVLTTGPRQPRVPYRFISAEKKVQ